MTEAIFGLVGVLVGGLLNGGISYVTSRLSKRNNARTASRLLYDEMLKNTASYQVSKRNDKWKHINITMSHKRWDIHHETLAEALPDHEWEIVSSYYFWIERVLLSAGEDDDSIGEGNPAIRALLKWEMDALNVVRNRAGVDRAPPASERDDLA